MGKKRNLFGGSVKFGGSEDYLLPPRKTNFAGTIWRPNNTTSLYYEFSPDKTIKTTSLYYEVSVGFVHRNWYGYGVTDGGRDGETDTRVKDLLASGVPPKGLTFGGTEGSMLGRRGWFNALSKGMV